MTKEQFKKYIEAHIRNNSFKTKEDLYRYLLSLQKREINYIITEEDIKELLKLFDELHKEIEIPLDMRKYTNKQLDDKNFIVSETEDRILKTEGNSKEFITEFKNTQNEMMAHSQDGNANAKEVFDKIADTQKEEIKLISLYEAINVPNIDSELLHKIKFFITTSNLNPHEFKVDLTNGIFYNNEKNELYEVRKNTNTNQMEIFVSGEIRYDNSNNLENSGETLENDHDEELQHQQSIENPKTKVRKLMPRKNNNNAAFAKVGLLLLNLISFTIIGISLYVLLANK